MQEIYGIDSRYCTSVEEPLRHSSQKEANEDNAVGFSDNTKDDNEDSINIIAHRGYYNAPDNTIPAIIEAAENGYKTVECDIEWTKDSVPVLLHDSTINKTARKANGKKLIFPRKCSGMTYEQLLQYDFGVWKGEKYKGTKIPTFQELLDCSREYDLNLYIELKKNSCFNNEKAKILVDAVKEAGMEDKVTWISFEDDYLQEIKDIMPDARLGYLSEKTPDEKTIDVLENLKTDENEVFLDIKASKMNKDASEMINDSGFEFESWTVNNCDEMKNLYDYDCQGITTDIITEEMLEEYNKTHNIMLSD